MLKLLSSQVGPVYQELGFLILLARAPGEAVVEAGVEVEVAAGEARLLTDALR